MKKVLGFVILLIALGGSLFLSGGIKNFIDMPSLIMIALLTSGFTLINLKEGYSQKDIYIRLKRYSVYSGWIIFFFGIIAYFSTMSNNTFEFKIFASCIVSIFYGYLASFIFDSLSE
ncbi:hypothetical protein [Desnuesiella massiliensis]|uniref:hypothetical protein n=1 Tax=Desnuesiella massiliensis TaxID=1650662 RepID=UPI0006E2549D|nr:hypothetical protein [Desnuesiella massiliensis]